jgi:hypothetical protein
MPEMQSESSLCRNVSGSCSSPSPNGQNVRSSSICDGITYSHYPLRPPTLLALRAEEDIQPLWPWVGFLSEKVRSAVVRRRLARFPHRAPEVSPPRTL